MNNDHGDRDSRNVKLASWLVPAALSAIVSVAAIVQGCVVALSAQNDEHALEVAKIKLQIVQSLNAYDFPTARVLMIHVLKPIDDGSAYEAFQREFLDIVADKAPGAQPAVVAEFQSLSDLVLSRYDRLGFQQVGTLTGKFRGPERLIASNQLVETYRKAPGKVVDGLLAALLTEKDSASYRVNLYVVFTLARLRPHWIGTSQQLERIKELRSSPSYREPTFRDRVEEAISNWSPRSR